MAFCGYLKQSTAVDIIVGPFVDEDDGKTAETGLTITQADVRLSKNGANIAQKNDASALSHDELGNYKCDLDATDTDTLGILVVMIHEAGALPVKQEYQVASAHWYDTMCSTDLLHVDVHALDDDETAADNLESACDNYSVTRGLSGTALPAAAADAAGGLPISDAGGLDLDTQIGTDIDAILTDTNELQTDDIPGLIAGLNDPTAADVVNEWETQSQADPTGFHVNVMEVNGTAQTANDNGADINAILTDTNELQTDDIPGLIAGLNDPTAADIADAVWDEDVVAAHNGADTAGAFIDDIDDILTDTGTTLPGTLTTMDGKLDTVDGIVDNILLDTAEIGAAGAGLTEAGGTGDQLSAIPWNAAWDAEVESEVDDAIAGLNDPTASDIADAVWDEASAGHTDAGKAGQQLWTDIDAILTDTNELQTDDIPGLIAGLNDPAAADIVNEWETQSQADPTGFHVNVMEINGTAQTANDVGSDVNDILTDTNELQTDDVPGLIAALNDPAAAAIADAVWDEVLAGHLGVGSTGEALNAAGAAGDPWSTALPGAYGAGSAGDIIGNRIDAAITSRSSHSANDARDAIIDDATRFSGADINAILTDTNELQTDDIPGLIAGLNDPTAADVTDAVWDEARAGHAGVGSFGETMGTVETNIDNLDTTVSSRGTADPGDAMAVDEIQASALADLFNTDSGETYAGSVAGSPVKEIVDNSVAGLTADTLADAVWDEAIAGHLGGGSTGAALNAAGGAGDPWSTAIPGAYVDGQAGYALSQALTCLSGPGATEVTYTLTDADSGLPIADANVWVTTDAVGANTVASGQTDDAGEVTFYLDSGVVYYVWRQKSGYNFTNPDTETVP